MTPEAFRLLQCLAAGTPVSGERYAADHGIGRAAVWKQIEQLRAAGVPVRAASGKGYQLAWPLEMLSEQAVREAAADSDAGIELVPVVASTNRLLIDGFRHRHALVAEYQTGGRGRRGRGWLSPPASGVYLSYGFEFQCGLPRLGPLSLVAGIAAAETLRTTGADVRLKWPNDLTVGDRKLGGLLVEIRGASDGPCQVVIGLGVNLLLPESGDPDARFEPPDQPWTDLAREAAAKTGRNLLTGALIAAMDQACIEFERYGFEHFRRRWQALDALRGREVLARSADGRSVSGRAAGVSERGGLLLERDGVETELTAAEVSVRVC